MSAKVEQKRDDPRPFKKVANFLKNFLTNTYTYVIIGIVQKDKTKKRGFSYVVCIVCGFRLLGCM